MTKPGSWCSYRSDSPSSRQQRICLNIGKYLRFWEVTFHFIIACIFLNINCLSFFQEEQIQILMSLQIHIAQQQCSGTRNVLIFTPLNIGWFFTLLSLTAEQLLSLHTQPPKASLPLLHQIKNPQMEPGNAFKASPCVNFQCNLIHKLRKQMMQVFAAKKCSCGNFRGVPTSAGVDAGPTPGDCRWLCGWQAGTRCQSLTCPPATSP